MVIITGLIFLNSLPGPFIVSFETKVALQGYVLDFFVVVVLVPVDDGVDSGLRRFAAEALVKVAYKMGERGQSALLEKSAPHKILSILFKGKDKVY